MGGAGARGPGPAAPREGRETYSPKKDIVIQEQPPGRDGAVSWSKSLLLDDTSRPPGTHTHEVVIRKGSVLRVAP
jgi:hypothetical protein